MRTRSFNMSDEDYKLISDYAYANRMSTARAMRYVIRTFCSPDKPSHDGIILDEDVRKTVELYASYLQRVGRPDAELINGIVNRLIRRGSASIKEIREIRE